MSFTEELEQLLNRYSMENASNTPDFILMEYLVGCLANFNITVQRREKWYGRDLGFLKSKGSAKEGGE